MLAQLQLIEQAKAILKANDTGVFIKPGTHQYPHQWNWDVAFNAIGLSYFDLTRAKLEVRSLLKGQWLTGKLPHILYHHGASDYFPTPDFWQTVHLKESPEFATSGLTQLPILATGVRLMFRGKFEDEETLKFIREVYPKILDWHRWWYNARDSKNTGLVSIIHPWESTDNSPRWDVPLDNVHTDEIPDFTRKDKAYVNENERPVEDHYNKYMFLIGFYRKHQWHDKTIVKAAPMSVQCVLVNVLLHQANQDLVELGKLINEDVSEIQSWITRANDAFETLWHKEDGLYYDRDLKPNVLTRENTWASLAPLFAGIPSDSRAKRMIEDHLLNPDEYAPSETSQYFLPCVSKSSPNYEPLRYWRGPVWLSANWIILQGLRRYGYLELAKQIKKDSLELVKKSGFVEYFDPRDGSPKGAIGFAWTAALALDLLLEKDALS